MPPLTLEQVLARSMRLPRRHAKHFISPATGSSAPGLSAPPEASVERESKSVARLFSLIEKEEEAVTAGRPSIHQSHDLIRNSQDLLTHLHFAKRMRAWEDALRFFGECTKILSIKEPGDGEGVSLALRENTDDNVAGTGITANVAHLSVLLDTCAMAKQWNIVEQLGFIFRTQFPQIVTDTVSLLARSKKTDVKKEGGLYGWKLALSFLRTKISPEEQPVEAYNACLLACERSLEWEAAFAIVQCMGPNVIQNLHLGSVQGNEKVDVLPASSATGATCPSLVEKNDAIFSVVHPPRPDVVTYATLISVLEQSGKDAVAREVLQRLPPLEKEEITASYAALIHVWSEQKYRRNRRRF